MAITRTNMIDDDGTGTTGTVINAAWKTELYNQIDGIGVWTDVPFLATDFFTAPAGGWTVTAGNVTTRAYTVIGKTMIVFLHIGGSTVNVAGSILQVRNPPGFSYASRTASNAMSYWAGALGIGTGTHNPTALQLTRDLIGNVTWPTGTTYISGVFFLPLA